MRPISFRTLPCLALGALCFFAMSISPADAQERFNVLRAAPPNSAPPPDFQHPDLAGKPHSLSDFKGKAVVLVFFATWCPLCAEEMPKFSALQNTYEGKGFTVLAVSVDAAGPNLVRRWAESKNLNYPILHDQKWASRRTHNVRFVPTAYLIDRAQKLAAWVVGSADWNGARARDLIHRALQNKAAAGESAAGKKMVALAGRDS